MGFLDGQLSLGIEHVFSVHLDVLEPDERAEANQLTSKVEQLKTWLEFGMNGWDEHDSIKYRENVRLKRARGDYDKRLYSAERRASTRIQLQADSFFAQEGAALSRRLASRLVASELGSMGERGSMARRGFSMESRALGAEARGAATAARIARGARMFRFIRGVGRIAKFARFL